MGPFKPLFTMLLIPGLEIAAVDYACNELRCAIVAWTIDYKTRLQNDRLATHLTSAIRRERSIDHYSM